MEFAAQAFIATRCALTPLALALALALALDIETNVDFQINQSIAYQATQLHSGTFISENSPLFSLVSCVLFVIGGISFSDFFLASVCISMA